MGRKKYGIGIAIGVVIDAVCLEGDDGYCTLHCEDASACPAGWECGPVTEYTLDGQRPTPEVGSASVCLRP